MTKRVSVLFILTLSFLFNTQFLFSQTANHVVISEILVDGVFESSSSNNDEFVEIYNPTLSPVDVSSWTIDYRSASSTSFNNKYTFPSGTIIQAHKYYLFGGGGVTNRDNSSDVVTLGLGNSGGGVFVRDASGNIIDLVGWGSAISGNYEGAAAPKALQGVSLERKAKSTSDASSMSIGGADELEGNGYDADNNANDFVQRTTPQPQNSSSLSEPAIDNGGNGTGTASISPAFIYASGSTDLTFKLAGDGTHTLTSAAVVIPSSLGWVWSKNLSDITASGNAAVSPSISIESDTIYISSIAVTSTDSLILKISNVTAPANAGHTDFQIETAVASGTLFQLNSLPRIQIIKIVPIAQIHINDSNGVPASPYGTGAIVSISGIITADFNSTSTDIYVQDATGGIDIYNSSRLFNYQTGDSVTITGAITQFRGLTEITPDADLFIINSHGNKIPDPIVITADDVNLTFNSEDYTEPNEGRLVRLNGVTYNSSNQTITDATGTTGAYLGNIAEPSGTFDIIGILKQYKPGTTVTPPYTADYEVNPRSQSDIIQSSGPVYLTKPVEKNILPNSITISFKTLQLSEAVVKYGASNNYTDSVVISKTDTVHDVVLPGLKPATIYHFQVGARSAAGTNYTGDELFSTASQTSTGIMNVYFNHSADTSVSAGENAQSVSISQKFINRINSAKYSIDLALYSLSGTVGAGIANALVSAKNRGVKVRVIGEYDNHSTAPWGALSNSGIPVIFDNFDPLNNGAGLMHNKFGVFDNNDTTDTNDWIWSGSWNATDPGNNDDAQNAIEIQDKSIANAYTVEFDEMWGSVNETPDASNSRFGVRKTDNTPHQFNIAGTPVELYFDPTDHTTSEIGAALNKAVSSINIAMLTFTRSDLAQILVNKKMEGKKVHIILDNNTDSGNQYSFLQNSGVDILMKGSAISGLLHHKYAIVDGDTRTADETVITGSHNWSNSAESSNNENTLIIHSYRIANLYLQEFKARYIEAGGSDIISGIEKQGNKNIPSNFNLFQNYPNPFNPTTIISFSIPKGSQVILKIFNILGQEVRTLVNQNESAGTYNVSFNASGLSSGIYFYTLTAGNFYQVKKMLLLR